MRKVKCCRYLNIRNCRGFDIVLLLLQAESRIYFLKMIKTLDRTLFTYKLATIQVQGADVWLLRHPDERESLWDVNRFFFEL